MNAKLAIPAVHTLRELRHMFARGGMPAPDRRTPEDAMRIAAFRAIEELLRLLEHFKRRVESGERCRLVERDHGVTVGRLHLEIEIQVES